MDFEQFLSQASTQNTKEKSAVSAVSEGKPGEKKHTVCLVDDLKSISSSMKREITLAARHSEIAVIIWEFQDPMQAVEHLQKNRPDLLITDVKMPYMTGDKLVEIVKKIYPDLPVIVVTGFATKENILSVYKSDKNSIVLSKPWEPKRLIETVAQLLGIPLTWPED